MAKRCSGRVELGVGVFLFGSDLRLVPVAAGVAERGWIKGLLQAPGRCGGEAAQGKIRFPQHQIHACIEAS